MLILKRCREYGSEGLEPISCKHPEYRDLSCVGSSGENFCIGYCDVVIINEKQYVICSQEDNKDDPDGIIFEK